MLKRVILLCSVVCFPILSKAQKADTVEERIAELHYKKCEIPPQCKEGYIYEYIDSNFNRPTSIKGNFDGEVVVDLFIDSSGTLSKLQLIKNQSLEIDRETLRVLSSTKWKPAINNFENVNYNLVLDIKMHNDSATNVFDITTHSDYSPRRANTNNTADSSILMPPDILPTFPGGLDGFSLYISKNIVYPSNAKKSKIQGKVYTRFIIEKDGSIGDLYIIRSPDQELSLEALRVLKNCPRFIPGSKNGKPVRTAFSMPIDFSLTRN